MSFGNDMREDILRRASDARAEYQRVQKDENARNPAAPDRARIRAAFKEVKACGAEYEAGLWQVQMAVCPYCAAPLSRSFDPFNMDGPWWAGVRPSQGPACPHYAFFRGSVCFEGGPAPRLPATGKVLAGPEAPYVIPIKLDLPNMIAVIGELEMRPGWRTLAISYFADPLPSAPLLTSDWCIDQYGYENPTTGVNEYCFVNDIWDFDLQPWLGRGKLRFCEPGSGNAKLADPSDPCPYLGLTGHRGEVEITSSGIRLAPPPDGSAVSPYE